MVLIQIDFEQLTDVCTRIFKNESTSGGWNDGKTLIESADVN